MAKHRRRLSNRSPSVDLLSLSFPLSLPDVYLLTAESAGQLAIGELTLVIDENGLRVIAPEGGAAANLAWAELTVLQTVGRLTAPGGEDAVLLEVSSTVRTHRFAVPTTDPLALESTIAAITGSPATRSSRWARKRG